MTKLFIYFNNNGECVEEECGCYRRRDKLQYQNTFDIFNSYLYQYLAIGQKYITNMQEYSVLPARKEKFTSSFPCKFVTNYYSIQLDKSKSMIYQYSYSVTPDVPSDSSRKLQNIIRNAWKDLSEKIGLISVRGNTLYGSKTINSITQISKFNDLDDEQNYTILIKKVKDLPLGEMIYSANDIESKIAIQVINADTKQRLTKLNMVELDKGRYYSKNKEVSQNFSNGFLLLKGYSFTAQKLKIGLNLHVQIFSRLIRQRNVLEQIQCCKSKDQIAALMKDAIVITRYGNFRTYKVIGVNFEKSPLSKFIPNNQQAQVTYVEYYKRLYDVEIGIKNQPLLHIVTKIQKVKRKGDKIQKIIHQGYLVPELVSLVGLSEQHTSNSLLMKQISMKTQISAQKRISETNSKLKELNNEKGLYSIGQVKVVDGYQLDQPLIQTKRIFKAQNGEIKLQKQVVKQPAEFKHWYFICHKNHINEARQLEKALKISAKTYGITLSESVFYEIQDTKAQYWREDIEEQFQYLKQNKQQGFPQMVMVLIGGNLKDSVYHEIKNLCTTKYKVCSQFTTVTKVASLNRKNHLLSYASSIILQMNSKIGKPIWQVPIRNAHLQKKTIGICAIAISKNPGGYALGFVGTINNKLSKVYNETKQKKKRNEFTGEVMSPIFINWLKCYYQSNNRKNLPEILVFYRQGLNPSEADKNVNAQVDALKNAINEAKNKTKISNYNPQIVYMSVNKRSTIRFYEQSNQYNQKFPAKFTNPYSGSVIVNQLSPSGIPNFNLASTFAPPNYTSSPSEVTIHYHSPARTPQQAFIELSFEQCFNYYNWKGAIKPPACLQNADRLAKLASKTLKEDITCENELSKTYHFL